MLRTLCISLVLGRSSAVPGLAYNWVFLNILCKNNPLKTALTIKDAMVIFAKRRGGGLSPGLFARLELRKLQSI